MAILPPSTDFTDSSVTEGGFKTSITSLREFIADLLGTDSADKGAARAALGVNGSGTVVQSLTHSFTTRTAITSTLPHDNTIPLISEGTEIFTKAITPVSGSNKIKVDVDINIAQVDATLFHIVVALFKGSTCIFARAHYASNQDSSRTISFTYEESASDTSARTYSLRIGNEAGSLEISVNGDSSAAVAQDVFGGSLARSTMRVTEIR